MTHGATAALIDENRLRKVKSCTAGKAFILELPPEIVGAREEKMIPNILRKDVLLLYDIDLNLGAVGTHHCPARE